MYDPKGQMTPHFHYDEFRCPCGKCDGGMVDTGFIWRLETLRELYNKPMRINSGVRCWHHNEAIGGATASYHLMGRAADIAIISDSDRHLILRLALQLQFGGIGLMSKAIHLDNRPTAQVCWHRLY